MADFYLREFSRLGRDNDGVKIPAPTEPALQDQKLTLSGSSQALTLHEKTVFVELHTDGAACHYLFNGTATTDKMKLQDGATVYKAVFRSAGDTVTINVISA